MYHAILVLLYTTFLSSKAVLFFATYMEVTKTCELPLVCKATTSTPLHQLQYMSELQPALAMPPWWHSYLCSSVSLCIMDASCLDRMVLQVYWFQLDWFGVLGIKFMSKLTTHVHPFSLDINNLCVSSLLHMPSYPVLCLALFAFPPLVRTTLTELIAQYSHSQSTSPFVLWVS